jgi:PAS domain S-box-containing protein
LISLTPLATRAGEALVIASLRDISLRRAAERALRAAEERYRSVLENASDGIVVLDAAGRIVEVNRSAAEIGGYSREQLLGKQYLELLAPEERAASSERFRAIFSRAGLRTPGHDLSLVAGKVIPIEYSSTLVELQGESVALVIIRDVSERRRVQEALESSERRFRTLFDKNPAGIFRATLAGRLLECNEAFAHLFGYASPRELIDFPVAELYFDSGARAGYIEALRRKGRVEDFEERLRRRDGTAVQVLGNAVLLHEPGVGEVIQGAIIDVTDLRRAQEALRSSERRYRELFEKNAAGVLRATVGGELLECNAAFARIFGFEGAHELTGLPCSNLYIDPAERDELIERLRAEGSIANFPIRGRRRDGSEAAVLMAASLVAAEEGEVLEGTVLDLTEKKQLEEQFRQAQKMEAMGRLAGGVAHDFNNLMMVVLGYSEMMLNEKPPAHPDREALQQIRASAERAVALTRQLLAFGRKQLLEPRVLDLNALVLEFGTLLRRLLGDDIRLETSTAEVLWPVRADPIQLEQVVLNLAVNARDAMPTGGTLTIATANVELNERFAREHPGGPVGAHVMLSVRDTGTGMSDELKARIFEPFFTTKESGKGTGLGLSTVYGIVKQSGGYIWVDSAPGKGTAFAIYLPRIAATEDELPGTPGETGALNGEETILVAEDSPAVRSLVVRVLGGYGYKVLTAHNGAAALEVAKQYAGPIHLLVTDVVMPEMGGVTLAERLSALRPELKVLYASGYTGDPADHPSLFTLDRPHLQKPFTPVALAQKVREVLNEGRGF